MELAGLCADVADTALGLWGATVTILALVSALRAGARVGGADATSGDDCLTELSFSLFAFLSVDVLLVLGLPERAARVWPHTR